MPTEAAPRCLGHEEALQLRTSKVWHRIGPEEGLHGCVVMAVRYLFRLIGDSMRRDVVFLSWILANMH